MEQKEKYITRVRWGRMLLCVASIFAACPAGAAEKPAAAVVAVKPEAPPPVTLEELRLTMDKWIETQQIISRERKDWQQGREIVANRTELIKKEIAELEQKIKQSEQDVDKANKKRIELQTENDMLKKASSQITTAVSGMEGEIRKLFVLLPDNIKEKLGPLYQRIPEDPTTTKISAAERYQNVLGILNELNKANNDIAVSYEVHTLANGKPAEVKAMYVGLAQAYYVSAGGEAGIGRPTAKGWIWEPSKKVSRDVLMALEIIQGKQSPAFVSLPVKME
jgi:hypothetical protein